MTAESVGNIELREYPSQKVVRIRERLAMADLPSRIPAGIREIHAHLERMRVTPSGCPYLQCPQPDATGMVDVEIGWPVDRDLPREGRIEAGVLPGGRAAWTEHRGSYDTVDKTYAALYEWIARNGLVPAGPARELYVTGPEVTDPKEIVTEVIAPVR